MDILTMEILKSWRFSFQIGPSLQIGPQFSMIMDFLR
jgi:hypothetical protein